VYGLADPPGPSKRPKLDTTPHDIRPFLIVLNAIRDRPICISRIRVVSAADTTLPGKTCGQETEIRR
jgi:hypothetical protein